MIRIDALWLCTQPQDMRAGANRLLSVVINLLGEARAHHGMRFNEGLPAHLADQLVTQFHEEHAERELLAFIYGHLGEHDLLGARSEAEKYLMLAALNLAECIAAAGAKSGAR